MLYETQVNNLYFTSTLIKELRESLGATGGNKGK